MLFIIVFIWPGSDRTPVRSLWIVLLLFFCILQPVVYLKQKRKSDKFITFHETISIGKTFMPRWTWAGSDWAPHGVNRVNSGEVLKHCAGKHTITSLNQSYCTEPENWNVPCWKSGPLVLWCIFWLHKATLLSQCNSIIKNYINALQLFNNWLWKSKS